ncbi:TetR/AcrR family transcriptional regulator [Rhodococcus sp. NPDC127528]|uniref:TetR/AcrR family transcriptional regulator n=2 Tax=unclassified Rhodococcus (in: high G+C Gram-positive bacteria) TaxID=192944 RepID=UPI00363682B6
MPQLFGEFPCPLDAMSVSSYFHGVSTKDRIIETALRLFGEQGFARTSVAQIEAEAGLTGGSGALYRHFRSKNALLVAAVASRLEQKEEWAQYLDPDFSIVRMLDAVAPDANMADRLTLLCGIGLARLEHNRDVTRILFRDNTIDKEVLETFRREEYETSMPVFTRGLAELSGDADTDWRPVAAVLIGAVAHFWMITDIFEGEHPAGVDAQQYLRATAELVAARLSWSGSGDAHP